MDRVPRHARKPRFGSLGSLGTGVNIGNVGVEASAGMKRGRSPSPAPRRLPAFPPRRVPLGSVRPRRSSSLLGTSGIWLSSSLPIPPVPERERERTSVNSSASVLPLARDYHPIGVAYIRVPRNRTANAALINLSTPAPGDEDGANRLRFFRHRPRRHADLPADAPVEALSPFAHAAAVMGCGSDSVCAVCGGGEALSYRCRKCALSFHNICAEEHDGLCGACAAPEPSASQDAQGTQNAKAHGLRALAAATAAGNPTDLVLHPGVLSGMGGTPRYEADWLRCVECDVLRVVAPGVLAECVRAPFRCSLAFWLPNPKCEAEQPDPAAVDALLTQIAHRPARRRRLFQKLGARHAARFGVSAPPSTTTPAPLPYKARAPPGPSIHLGMSEWSAGRMPEISASSGMLPIAPVDSLADGEFDRELARSRILGRIGQLHGLGPLEDILIDLTISNHPQLLEFYRSLWNNPELFDRQLIRLARAIHDHPRSRGSIGGGGGGIGIGGIGIGSGGGGGGIPGMSARMLERHEQAELHEGFRSLRVRQIGESIRLKQDMMRDVRACPVDGLPMQYGRHSQAEQSLLRDHNAQLREFWQMRLRRHGTSH